MRSWQEAENEVSHPLRALILIECEDALSKSIAAAVPGGTWSPSPGYLVLVAKRSGTYRELVFPGLVDTIIGRRIIDTLEPAITKDDNNRVFFGRSHANSDRRRGDYESWFKVWLDFSSQIGAALERGGFTYVFDTDVTQFFPSVDRERAKRSLAQRTGAHQTLLELLFYCIDMWAPRVRYCPVPGLPIEPNDVSRLIAHNFIKDVDEHFVGDEGVHYLRWVDDTVIFVSDERSAHDIKRKHHLALREVGLSPNSAKTMIQTSAEFAASRHPEFNRSIDEALTPESLEELAVEWFAKDPAQTPNWDKVGTRIYSRARKLKTDRFRAQAVEHVANHATLLKPALKYLAQYPIPEAELLRLTKFYGEYTTSSEARIELAKFFCDVRLLEPASPRTLLNLATGQLMSDDPRLGGGYARALLLLALNKYGAKAERDRVRQHLTIDRLQDDQLRLHYLYVFKTRRELDNAVANAARHLDTPDISLTMRLCEDALAGRLTKHAELLKACLSAKGGIRSVEAKKLPFLHALLHAEGRAAESVAWLTNVLKGPKAQKLQDPAIQKFLEEELVVASR